MIQNALRFFARRATLVALVAAVGCSGSSKGPNQPPPPDRSTARATMNALEDVYSRRTLDNALLLLAPDYEFFPARPDSIPFLGPGATSWDYVQEKAILELLLVEERTTWIDQVLLEVHRRDQRDLGNGREEYDARVELKLLIGIDSFVSAESEITYVLQADAEGNYLIVEERESPSLQPENLTVGELRADALEDRTNP